MFPIPSQLRSHRISVHSQRPSVADDNSTFQCCKCGCGFQTEEDLLQHQEKFASYLNCDVKPQGKKRGRKPKCAAQEWEVDEKKIKQEEEMEECNDSLTEESSTAELKIPCPEEDCDCIFPSVAALRAHKKDVHASSPL